MRGLETDRLVLTTEYREGKVRVVVEAKDEAGRAITDLKLEGKVSSPGGLQEGRPPIDLKFEQRAGGYYEAEFKAEEAGSYIVNAQARQRSAALTTLLLVSVTSDPTYGRPVSALSVDTS